ncbi:hypothetical protein [Streptomyces sp. NPDC049881]
MWKPGEKTTPRGAVVRAAALTAPAAQAVGRDRDPGGRVRF